MVTKMPCNSIVGNRGGGVKGLGTYCLIFFFCFSFFFFCSTQVMPCHCRWNQMYRYLVVSFSVIVVFTIIMMHNALKDWSSDFLLVRPPKISTSEIFLILFFPFIKAMYKTQFLHLLRLPWYYFPLQTYYLSLFL